MTATTSLIDLRWIPVRHSDGTTTDVGLRELFLRADQCTDLAVGSPLEHEALLRFLTTITALVVRAAGPTWDPRRDPVFPAHGVDTALSWVAEHLDLAGAVSPFMQDPPTEQPASTAKVSSLAVERPNPTVQAWHFRGELNEHADGQVTWSRLAVLLVTFWYFSGANNVDIAGRKQTGALCGKAGNGLHLFWRGPALVHTLLANTPLRWTVGTDLPAWADRDGTVSGADFAGAMVGATPLWWGSYSPNTVMVWREPDTGLPARCVTGGSPRQPRGTPAPMTRAAKDTQAKVLFDERHPTGTDARGRTLNPAKERDRIFAELAETDATLKTSVNALMDQLRAGDPAGTLAAPRPEKLSSMSPDLAPLRNLSAWYEAGAAELLAQRTREVVLAPSRRGGTWALEFCHTRTKNPTALIYTSAAWVGRTPNESVDFTLDAHEARAVLAVAKRVEEIAEILCRPLSKGSTLPELNHTRRDLKDHFYYRADAACTQAVKDAADGKEMGRDVLDTLRGAALVTFDEVITPFAGSVLGAAIIQARTRIQWDITKVIG